MKSLTFLFLFICINLSFSQVGIGTTNPDPSSILELESTTSGILIPRMTQTQRLAIGSPVEGLMVYQTNGSSGFWFYDGSVWHQLTFGASGEFQSIGGIVQNTTNIGSDDFVFGSSALSGSGSRFFFDKSKGAFRAGETFGTEWNDINVGVNSIALGLGNTASGQNSFAYGQFATASGDGAVAFMGGDALGSQSFAGIYGSTSGLFAIALQGGNATEESSIAIGFNSESLAENAIVIGNGSTISATGTNGLALGSTNAVSGANATAIGFNSTASGQNSFAYGQFATASGAGAVSFMGGDASGNESFAGIYGTASETFAIALQGGNATEESSIAIGFNSESLAANAIAIGNGSTISATGSNGLALGSSNTVSGANATAIGTNSSASGQNSFAYGQFATASGAGAVAFTGGEASANESFAGIYGTASGVFAIALNQGEATGDASFAFGPNSEASQNESMAIGYNADASAINSIAIGKDVSSSGNNSITMGTDLSALSYAETVFGFRSEAYTPISSTISEADDRLFVIGNGDATTGIPLTNNALTILKDGGTGIMRIPITNILEINGNASKTTAGDWLANSDSRLKKNINTFSEKEALKRLLKMLGVTYEWNDSQTGNNRPEGQQYGFIAQELQEVFPENVSLDNQGFYQTAYGTYDALYVQSIKALNSKVETLENENKELKAKLNELYDMVKARFEEE